MREYWSCTNFADRLRGTSSPKIGSAQDYRDFRASAQSAHPFRYWLAETALDKIQDILYCPQTLYRNVHIWLLNRWVHQPHRLTAHPTNLKPGRWVELDDRFLPCLFDSLVDFVEQQKAYHWYIGMKDQELKQVPRFGHPGFELVRHLLGIKPWRNREWGLAYLDWEINDTGEYQSNAAREILEIYNWYTQEYPNRADPMEESGLREIYDAEGDEFMPDRTPEQKLVVDKALKRNQEIEKRYYDQETEMMHRLIKIRQFLWT